jgi:hypothetical protein
MQKFKDLVNHVFHFVPWNDVDLHRLAIHIFASFLGALATILNSGIPAKVVLVSWLSGALIYISGYMQRSYKTDVEVPAKELSEQ